jgi:hypothetical protein
VLLKSTLKIEEVDPVLQLALDQWGKELLQSEHREINKEVPNETFVSARSIYSDAKQVIFSTKFETDFYNALLKNKNESRLIIVFFS